jgi:hypothetical protein
MSAPTAVLQRSFAECKRGRYLLWMDQSSAPSNSSLCGIMQFNARTTPQTVEALYAIADRQGWLVGETLEHALTALQRELD